MKVKKKTSNSEVKQLGKRYMDGGNLDLAITCLMDYLKKVPNDTEVLNWLGQAFREKGKFEKAEDYFRRALSINEKDEITLYGLAQLNDVPIRRTIPAFILSKEANHISHKAAKALGEYIAKILAD